MDRGDPASAARSAGDLPDFEAATGAARQLVVHGLVPAMHDAGRRLWAGGSIFGPDRRDGASPFGFGDDRVVGLATLLQIGAELLGGASTLLREDNRYAAMALTRQIVEVEYLSWAFAEDSERTAAQWLRSSASDRLRLWQPRHLRKSSKGRFRGSDYGMHCEHAGHPTPVGRGLLPDHRATASTGLIWHELCIHGLSAWDYCAAAAEDTFASSLLVSAAEASALATSRHAWELARTEGG